MAECVLSPHAILHFLPEAAERGAALAMAADAAKRRQIASLAFKARGRVAERAGADKKEGTLIVVKDTSTTK